MQQNMKKNIQHNPKRPYQMINESKDESSKDEKLQHEETQYIQQQNSLSVQQVQHSHKLKKKKEEQQSNKKLTKWQRRFYLNQILQYIFEVADRNEVYRSNFIHAHIPFVIIFKLLDYQIQRSQKTYLKEVIKVLVHKIKQKNLKAQLNKQEHFDEFMIIAANPNANQQQLLIFLRKFIEQNKEIMKGFIPYYYNYFALAVNKQIVFNGKVGELIQYTIDYKHKEPYTETVTQSDIMNILDVFERKLVQKYHSEDI